MSKNTTAITTVSTKNYGDYWKDWKPNKPVNNIPFLPDGWEKKVYKLQKQGYKSAWRNQYFETLCKMKQSKLKKHLEGVLSNNGYSSIVNGDGYLYAKGEIPVLLVAHMDTVHKELPKNIIYKDEYVMSPQGIGGDDRCGIYMVTEIIKDMKCHVVFTEDEEIGCIGARLFAKSETAKELNGVINYIVEFDRKGSHDAVYYSLYNPDFENFIEPKDGGFFKNAWGTCSDICEIAPAINAAAVNFSCGYYQAHTVDEYVNLKEMNTVIEEAKKIIAVHDKHYDYEDMYERWYSNKNSKYYGRYGGWYDDEYYDSYYGGYYGGYYGNKHKSVSEESAAEKQQKEFADWCAEQEYEEYCKAQDEAYWKDKYDSKNEKNLADDEMIYENGEWKSLYESEIHTYELYWKLEERNGKLSEFCDTVKAPSVLEAIYKLLDLYGDTKSSDIISVIRID